MIKIAFDVSPLLSGHSSRGVGFYTENLLSSLKQIEQLEVIEFTDINQVKHADLVHYPFFDFFLATLPLIKRFKTVVTIHDVIPLLFPSHYPKGLKGSINYLRQSLALGSVRAVITDSICSKEDIAKTFHFPHQKIYPIYLAAPADFKKITDQEKLKEIKKKYQLPAKFVLYIGNVNWNKNILSLVEGCLNADIDLVIIGKSFTQRDDLDHPELASFKTFLAQFENNPKVHPLGFVESNDLVAITNLAEIGLLPSYYEGFGLPILEYQACGIPVITSDVSSMPEVAGNGAVLISPHDRDEITQAIQKIISDYSFRKELIKEGFANLSSFSWEKCAKETADVYQQVIQN